MKYNVIFCEEDMGIILEMQLEENSLYELLHRVLYDGLIPEGTIHLLTEEQ